MTPLRGHLRRGHLRRAALVLLTGALGGLAVPAPASAHAYLARSAPADGAVLDQAPQTLTLSFTEHVELGATRVEIVDGDGQHWAVTSLTLRTAADDPVTAAGTEEPVDIVAGLPALAPNTYHISWRTLSSDDLHTTRGTVVFGIQREVASAAAVAGPSGPGIREAVLRAVGLVGLAVALGGAALTLLHALLTRRRHGHGREGEDSDPLPRRLLRISAGGAAVALVAVPAQLVVQVSAGDSAWLRLLGQQATSPRWLMRELGLGLLVGVLVWAERTLRTGRSWWLGGRAHSAPALTLLVLGSCGALSAAAGTALLGHPMGSSTVTVLAGGLHVLAAGAWGGGVVAAALALAPEIRARSVLLAHARGLLRSFAALAVTCLVALTVTGLVMAGSQISTVDALLTSPYGVLLLAKVVAAAVAGAVGWRSFGLLRRHGSHFRGRRVVVEAAVIVVVLSLAGTLAAAGPARGPAFPVAGAPTVPQVNGQVADLVDTLTVRPNRPGRNVVSITLADTRRPAPAPVTGVSLTLNGPDGTAKVHPVTRGPDGWTVTVDDVRTSGRWSLAVTVMRDGMAPVTDTHAWVVAASGPATVTVSAAPLQPALGWLAAAVAVLAALAAGVLGYRRVRRRGAPPGGYPAAPRRSMIQEAMKASSFHAS